MLARLPLKFSENGRKKIKPLELSDPIDISSDEKEDLKSGTKDEELLESFADVELDEPVFHKLASPKKLRKRSSSIRSVNQNDRDPIEKDESEDEKDPEQPQRRKSSRVRRSVLPEKKDDENETEEPSLPQRPRSRQENGQKNNFSRSKNNKNIFYRFFCDFAIFLAIDIFENMMWRPSQIDFWLKVEGSNLTGK